MLREKTESNSKFLVVKHHSLCLESKEPKEGYEEITVHNPQTDHDQQKWIKRYAAVDGMVSKLEWYDTRESYKTRFLGVKVHLKDNGEYFQLDLPFNSRPYDSFTKMAENIDFTKPVEFSVWHDRKTDNTAFAIRQGGIPVKWKYTRDDMGECPVPTQDAFGKWNFQKQREWLYHRLVEVIIPQVEALNAFDEPEPEYSGEDSGVEQSDPTYSDEKPSAFKQAVLAQEKGKAATVGGPPEFPPFEPRDEDAPPEDSIPF